MAIHKADTPSANPRLQCKICGKWKRLNSNEDQLFYGACGYAVDARQKHGIDCSDVHLAAQNGDDVCHLCCEIECKRIFQEKTGI